METIIKIFFFTRKVHVIEQEFLQLSLHCTFKFNFNNISHSYFLSISLKSTGFKANYLISDFDPIYNG